MTPLVVFHGFTGSAASWDTVAAALPDVIPLRLQLLGHGANDTGDVHTFRDEITRLAAELPQKPVHLAGYSLGARLALGLAVTFPERVARLTLLSGQPGLASDADRDARRRADASWCELLDGQGIEAFANAWEAQPLFATQARLSPLERAQRRTERLRHDPAELARSLRVTGLAEMPDYSPQLGSFSAPVTLLAGELDPKFLELGQAMCAALPRARLVIAPDAGHDLLLEAPNLVARELVRQP